MKLKIVDLDLSLQTRAGTDAETINTYAEAMADGAQFPEVTVFTDGVYYWLADGFHRVMAAKQLGKNTIAAEVREGTEDDAVVFGGTANNKQGKRPTRADVQHFLEMVWERREAIFGGTPTGGNVAEKCGVSRETGRKFVEEKLAAMPVAPVRPTANVGQLPTRPNAPIQAPKMPVRPTQLVGANGKMYPVRPMPVRPVKSEVVIPRDRFGTEVPPGMEQAFETDAFDEVVNMISRARVALRNGVDDKNLAFAAVPQEALIMLNNAYNFVKASKAYCVCRICNGEGCSGCKERGFQTAEQYERNPKEYKA